MAAAVAVASFTPAFAQTRNQPKTVAPPAPAPPPPLPPYEPELLRLSEILGALAYLRDLCGEGDSDEWRKKMSGLIDAEATNDTARGLLVGAFNQGFRGYQLTYRTCTPNARLIISRFLDEGGTIARDVSNRFGGG